MCPICALPRRSPLSLVLSGLRQGVHPKINGGPRGDRTQALVGQNCHWPEI